MDCVHEKMVQIHPPHPKNFCEVMFMYVHPYRRLVRGFLLFILYCALAAPVARADVALVGGSFYIFVATAGNCCCSNIICTWKAVTGPFYGVDGNTDNYYTNGGTFSTTFCAATPLAYSSTGYGFLLVSVPDAPYDNVANPNAGTQLQVNIADVDSVQMYKQVYNIDIGNQPTNFTFYPQAYGDPSPCGNFGGAPGNYMYLPLTNYSGSYAQAPDGSILAPGQGENYGSYMPRGVTTTNLNLMALNPANGIWQDGPQFTVTNGISWNGSQYSNVVTFGAGNPPQVGAFSDSLYTNQGGPIIWQASTLSNTASVDAAGFSDVANNQLLQDQLLSNLLSRPLTVQMGSNGFGGSASNVWVENWPSNFNAGSGGSNVFNGGSNVWVENWPWSNGIGGISNLLQGTFVSATNGGYSIMNPLTGAGGPGGSIEGGIPTTIADQPGQDELGEITVGNGTSDSLTFSLISFPTQMNQFYSELRGLISWCIIVGSLLWNCRFAFDCISEVLRTKGVQGMSTGPLTDQFGGWAIAGIVISAFLLALIVTIPVSIAGLLSGELSFLPSTTTATNFLSGTNTSLLWVENFFPVWVFVSSCGFEIVFFFAVRGYCLVIQSAIRLIPGA
jgi:hypothetical protein